MFFNTIIKRALTANLVVLAIGGVVAAGFWAKGWYEEENNKLLLGGDIEIARGGIPLPFDASAYMLFSSERISRISETATPATFGNLVTMVGLKGVDAAYPLYGKLLLSGDTEPNAPIFFNSVKNRLHGAAVDKKLLSMLNMKLGDVFEIGGTRFVARAMIVSEPDLPSPMTEGLPRVITNNKAVYATGLADGDDNRVIFRCRARLEEGIEAKRFSKDMELFFDSPDWATKTWHNPLPPNAPAK